jgi:hypothetical protein
MLPGRINHPGLRAADDLLCFCQLMLQLRQLEVVFFMRCPLGLQVAAQGLQLSFQGVAGLLAC